MTYYVSKMLLAQITNIHTNETKLVKLSVNNVGLIELLYTESTLYENSLKFMIVMLNIVLSIF